MTTALDRINRAAWGSRRVLGEFARRDGWIDAGEERAMQRIASAARAQPVLDIGVGAGRTLPYLRGLSDNYVGIDYIEEAVRLARARHPDARIEQADARDLSAFAAGSFAVVVFSFNGIDGVAHEERRDVFAAVHRVLQPGGLFAYSTHNLDHARAGRPPWDRAWLAPHDGVRRTAVNVLRLPRRARAYRRLRPLEERGEGWATLVDSAYDFSVLFHHVTLPEALRELRAAGFAEVEVYDSSGGRLVVSDDASRSPWIHLVAVKR